MSRKTLLNQLPYYVSNTLLVGLPRIESYWSLAILLSSDPTESSTFNLMSYIELFSLPILAIVLTYLYFKFKEEIRRVRLSMYFRDLILFHRMDKKFGIDIQSEIKFIREYYRLNHDKTENPEYGLEDIEYEMKRFYGSEYDSFDNLTRK